MEVYETTILRPLHKLIKVFASCFVRSALATTSQFLPSIWILDGAGRSGCHHAFHVHRWRGLPLRTDWLSESAGSQLSPAACEKSWRALEYKASLSSIGGNFLQLSP